MFIVHKRYIVDDQIEARERICATITIKRNNSDKLVILGNSSDMAH